jgi:hypothetical protein
MINVQVISIFIVVGGHLRSYAVLLYFWRIGGFFRPYSQLKALKFTVYSTIKWNLNFINSRSLGYLSNVNLHYFSA